MVLAVSALCCAVQLQKVTCSSKLRLQSAHCLEDGATQHNLVQICNETVLDRHNMGTTDHSIIQYCGCGCQLTFPNHIAASINVVSQHVTHL